MWMAAHRGLASVLCKWRIAEVRALSDTEKVTLKCQYSKDTAFFL